MSSKLTPKQEQFCHEYLIDKNATQAALRAGYAEKTAHYAAQWIQNNNPKKPKLKKRIDELKQDCLQRTDISADDVIEELKEIALAKVKITEKSKMKALELLGKYFGLFTANADNSDTLAKLDEVLGRIEGEI